MSDKWIARLEQFVTIFIVLRFMPSSPTDGTPLVIGVSVAGYALIFILLLAGIGKWRRWESRMKS